MRKNYSLKMIKKKYVTKIKALIVKAKATSLSMKNKALSKES